MRNRKFQQFVKFNIVSASLIAILFSGCSTNAINSREGTPPPAFPPVSSTLKSVDTKPSSLFPAQLTSSSNTFLHKEKTSKSKLIRLYEGKHPLQWGEKVTGVRRKLDTHDKVIALTFDACGGKGGEGFDARLINFLIKEKIPATLFINGRWIDANKKEFQALAGNPLFEIENHGTEHKPLSVLGKSVYHIQGTRDVGSVVDEVLDNARKIESLTGRKPRFFRSGTAYYDEVAVRIVNDLGEEAVNFNVLGDGGATFSKDQVYHALLSSTPGSIVICHMNHPEKQTAPGVIAAVPELRKQGYSFVKLDKYRLL